MYLIITNCLGKINQMCNNDENNNWENVKTLSSTLKNDKLDFFPVGVLLLLGSVKNVHLSGSNANNIAIVCLLKEVNLCFPVQTTTLPARWIPMWWSGMTAKWCGILLLSQRVHAKWTCPFFLLMANSAGLPMALGPTTETSSTSWTPWRTPT